MNNNFTSLLALLFIGLKLADIIDWSWWLVLLPLYFWGLVWATAAMSGLICSLFEKRK